MLGRRIWLTSAVAALLAYLPRRRTSAQEGISINSAERLTQRNIRPLEDQLTKGLRATTSEQVQFVKLVATHVEQGLMPRAMVNLVYRWALERNPQVPFPYFEYALRALSKRRGLSLR